MNKPETRTAREALRQGFTLIEILVVVAIIALLGAVVVPNLMGGLDDSRLTAAREVIQSVETALNMYSMKHGGKYPDSLEALTQETDDEEALLQGDYVDPWGQELKYEKQGKKRPLLTSAGPDEEFGTEDDLTNKDTKKKKSSERTPPQP